MSSLASIPGGLPDLRAERLPACRYRGRCERRTDACEEPPPIHVIGDSVVACWNPL